MPSSVLIIVKETTHINNLFLFLLLLLLGFSFYDNLCSWSGTSGGGTTSSITSVSEKLSDVLSFKGLSEKSGPVGFNLITRGFDNLIDLFSLIYKK